jgi:hypothetical protein
MQCRGVFTVHGGLSFADAATHRLLLERCLLCCLFFVGQPPMDYQSRPDYNGPAKPSPLVYVLDLFRFRHSADPSRPRLRPLAARTGLLTIAVLLLLLTAFILLLITCLAPAAFLKNGVFLMRLCAGSCATASLPIGPWTVCALTRGRSAACAGAIGYSWDSVLRAVTPNGLRGTLPGNEGKAGVLLLVCAALTGLALLLHGLAMAELVTARRKLKSGAAERPFDVSADRVSHLSVLVLPSTAC